MAKYNALVSEDGTDVINIHSIGVDYKLLSPDIVYTKAELNRMDLKCDAYKLCDFVEAMNSRGNLTEICLIRMKKPPRNVDIL